MKSLRKTFIVSTMAVTVLAMSMVMPAPAGAVAQAGDLIKMDGLSSVYYLGADGKRYVFPNEGSYFSWYADFSSVVTIPQSELESYALGANVTMRPGTNLVKITTDPKVYAVEPGGNLLWVPDEETALALYGADWAARVVDVPDAFFTNYTVSTEQVSNTAYPAGTLATFGGATVYYIAADGTARAISDEASFTANRFSWDDVITSSLTMPTEGAALAGAESGLIDTSEGAGGTAGAGTGLTVSLAGDTAASVNVPSKSTLVSFVTVNLTASADGDVTVQNLTFTRTGTGATTDFDGGYLFVGDARLTTKRSVNASENTINFNALNLTIPAGMTKQVTLKMNGATAGEKTGNHAFKLTAASAVTTNGAVVSGSFPVQGNLMSYSAVAAATVIVDGSANSSNKKVGETNIILGEFTIANDAQEIVNIYRIRLKQNGTAGNDAVNNMSLDLDGTIVKEGVSMVDKYVDFMMDTSFELKKSKTITATVRGDIVGDISKNVQLYLKNVADIDVRGTAYGDFYSAMITKQLDASSDLANPAANEADVITIQGSEINVSFDGPAAADTKDDITDLVLANFKINSTNLDVNIETLRVVLTVNSTSNQLPINIEMVDSANNVSYSVADPASSTPLTYNLDFENIYITAGTQYNFQIRGDIQDLTNTGATYEVAITFSSATARFQDSNETLVVAADWSQTSLSGKTMTIASPAIVIAKVTTNASTVVKDANGVLLYKGKLVATNVDDLKVSKIGIASANGDPATQLFSLDWSKLYLYKVNSDSTETLLDFETSLGATTVSFSGFSMDLPKGISNGVYVVVRGDVKSSPNGTTTVINLPYAATNYTVRDSDNNAVTANGDAAAGHITTVATVGACVITFDQEEVGVNADQNILAGNIRKLGRFKITATKENAIIEDLVLQNDIGAANEATNITLATLYLYSDSDMTTLLGTADLGADAHKNALFEDVNIEIPTTGVTYIYVGGLVKGIDYSASPGPDSTAVAAKTVNIRALASGATGYTSKIIGASTGETYTASEYTFTANSTTATSTVMGAVISAVTTDFGNATLVQGANRDIFSFKVTAPASGNIDHDGTALGVQLATTTFSFAATTDVGIATFKIERVGGATGEKDALIDGGGATATSSGEFVINFLDTYGTTNNTDLTIRPGDTAEYIVRATTNGVGASGETLQVTIEGMATNCSYVHNTASSAGVDGNDTTAVYPLLPGISYVRGGTLSN